MENTNIKNWIDKELETFPKQEDFEELPSFKLVPNVVTEIDIDFSQPFKKWSDTENDVVKSIIPVSSNGMKMNWWINIKNPIYHQILEEGKKGVTKFKILQTGTLKNTRYTLVK